MSDVLTEFLAEGPIVKRPVVLGGKTGELHFRRLSLSDLLKAETARGEANGAEDREIGVATLVHLSVCDAKGNPRFATPDDAKKLGGVGLMALYRIAADVNSPGGDLGKA